MNIIIIGSPGRPRPKVIKPFNPAVFVGIADSLGAAAITDAADIAAGVGVVPATGVSGIPEAPDIAVGTGEAALVGVGAISQDPDSAVGTGSVPASGTAGITDSPDVAAGVGELALAAVALIQEAADVLAATALVATDLVGTITESPDTGSGAGVAPISGEGAIQEGPNLLFAAGTFGQKEYVISLPGVPTFVSERLPEDSMAGAYVSPTVVLFGQGMSAIQETADALTAAGDVAIAAAANIQEAASTIFASGAVDASGQAAILDVADALTAAGAAAIAAAGALQDAGDMAAGAGTVVPGLSGAAAIIQAPDTVTSTAVAPISGAGAITGSADVATGAGDTASPITGVGAMGSAPDTLSATGTSGAAVGWVASITDAPSVLIATAQAAIAASSMITESADILFATASVFPIITGTGAITEAPDTLGQQAVEAPDTAAGAGKVPITGTGTVIQGADVAAAAGPPTAGALLDFPDVAAGTGKVAVTGTAQIFQFPDVSAATGTAPQQALLQSDVKAVNGVSGTTLAFPLNLTPGNLLVVSQVHFQGGGASIITTPTDTLHSSLTKPYLPMVAEQRTADGLVALRSFYLEDCLGGPCTVNFDIAGAGTGELTVIVSEWNGRALVSPLSVAAVATGPANTTTPSSGDIAPIDDKCLLIALLNAGGSAITITPEAGWTTAREYEGVSNTVTLSMIYKLQVGTPVIEDADWTISVAKSCLSHVAAFKPLAAVSAEQFLINQCMLQGHGR